MSVYFFPIPSALANRKQYERNLKSIEHGPAPIVRYPAAFAWLRDRHDGKPVDPGCKTVDVQIDGIMTLLTGEGILYIKFFAAVLLAVFGVQVNGDSLISALLKW
jgi:hypothetical protein